MKIEQKKYSPMFRKYFSEAILFKNIQYGCAFRLSPKDATMDDWFMAMEDYQEGQPLRVFQMDSTQIKNALWSFSMSRSYFEIFLHGLGLRWYDIVIKDDRVEIHRPKLRKLRSEK